MILDKEAELVTTVAYDLETTSPGPGKPINMWASGIANSLVITHGDTSTAADPLLTVDAVQDVEFRLPSNTKRFIKASFASGSLNVILEGAQTNS